MPLLMAALVFVIIILIFGVIFAFAVGAKEADIIRGRLEAIERGTSFARNALDLELMRDELLSSIPAFNKVLGRWRWPTRLRSFIGQAGMDVRPGKIVLICAVMGLAALEVGDILYRSLLIGVSAGAVAALLPVAFIAIKRARRLRAFEKQFPEVIELLSRSVRAGHSFASGLEIVASDLPDPVAAEFRITFDEQRFGLPLRDALLSLSERVPLVDVRIFVIALLVQKETGGNLVEILDKLAYVIRERFRVAGEVRVRTAQGRLSAVILIALPLAILLILRVMDPGYVNLLFTDRMGQYMLMAAAASQALGALIIWRIVQIKV